MIDNAKLWRKSPNPNGKKKDSFQLYYTMADSAITILQDSRLIGLWFQALIEYELYGKEPTFSDANEIERATLQAVFILSSQQLDATFKAWCDKCIDNANHPKGKGEREYP